MRNRGRSATGTTRAPALLLAGVALVMIFAAAALHFVPGASQAEGSPLVLPPSPGAALVSDPLAEMGGLDLMAAFRAALMEEGAIEEPAAQAQPSDERRALARDGRFAMPLKAWTTFTDRYGAARGRGLIHGGIDLSLETYHHAEVYAACAGTVTGAQYSASYGNHVTVDCGDGWSTLYAHLSEMRVAVGSAVTLDTVLGISGSTGFSTGEHLHFEIRWQGTPVNPEDYLDFHIPADAPLSNGPIWFGDPVGRTKPAASGRTGSGSGAGAGATTSDPREAATPSPTRPAPTPTPTQAPVTPTRYATPTPRPTNPGPTPTKPPATH